MDLKKFKVIINIILILIIICLYLLEKSNYEEPKDKIDKDIMSITNNQTNNQINNNKVVNKKNNNINDTNYIAKIIIPKINLNQKLFDKNSSYNNVNKNIQILKESTMPDIENSNLILASHSGNSKVAYFTNLKDLSLGDSVFIEYKNFNYEYCVYKIVVVDKDGKIEIGKNSKDNYLTLITCKLGTNKQYVIICKLKRKQKL